MASCSYPTTLTPALGRVLGMMVWETGPIAHALRAAGHVIERTPAAEQAAVLHWLTSFALEHGADWERHAAAALHALTESRRD
ncbi:hypothetical protein BLA13014_04130 [Burkholderia aenigmatica]|uniref:Uncharacterized protein n=1 Tax=Burkholderia aenigmatica TaxID=2015348 RepID=A0A6P2N9M4_9BURK|nr:MULTISPECIES: hypothetical protein [Burkholderia]VWB89157.1 hypothetical protein BLA13014_04130 [Burkholderia aenigmatica]